MHFALICDDQYPIAPLLEELKQKGIDFEIRQQQDKQELWLADEHLVMPVSQAYDAYKRHVNKQKQYALTTANIKQLPVTTLLIVMSLLVAALTQLGEHNQSWFYIAQMQFYPRAWIPYEGVSVLWHSISPIFLHFGVEHLVFNSLSCWYLGSILERKLPSMAYVLLIVLMALISNYSQLYVSGPLFGGLSGVVYGFIGFAACAQWLGYALGIPKGLFYIAIGWLLLGYTPIFEAVGLGSMANAAHLSGLISGGVLFFLFQGLLKKQHYGH